MGNNGLPIGKVTQVGKSLSFKKAPEKTDVEIGNAEFIKLSRSCSDLCSSVSNFAGQELKVKNDSDFQCVCQGTNSIFTITQTD